eukprot:2746678-Amphidinium_carterae.1
MACVICSRCAGTSPLSFERLTQYQIKTDSRRTLFLRLHANTQARLPLAFSNYPNAIGNEATRKTVTGRLHLRLDVSQTDKELCWLSLVGPLIVDEVVVHHA